MSSLVVHGEEFSGFGDEGGAVAVGEHAVRANAMKSFWEDMQQEAADELVDIKGHGGVTICPFDPVILPFEGDAAVVDGDQPSIGDGDPVGVTGEVSQDLAGSCKMDPWHRPPNRSCVGGRDRP